MQNTLRVTALFLASAALLSTSALARPAQTSIASDGAGAATGSTQLAQRQEGRGDRDGRGGPGERSGAGDRGGDRSSNRDGSRDGARDRGERTQSRERDTDRRTQSDGRHRESRDRDRRDRDRIGRDRDRDGRAGTTHRGTDGRRDGVRIEIGPRWRSYGDRGRRYRGDRGWYFWAPWAGSYVYFGSEQACFASCRERCLDRGYRRGQCRRYCSDLCAW